MWSWTQEFTADEKGMEVACELIARDTYRGAISWSYPPQDARLLIEWLGGGDAPPTTVGAVDITGAWSHGSGVETWVFTPTGNGRYNAVESGFGNAKGTATVSGNTVTLDYTTAIGIKGQYVITVASNGTTAIGKWNDDSPSSGERNFTKLSKPTGPPANPPITSGMTLRSESRKVQVGENTTVPVWIDRAADVANINFELTYLPSVVTTVDVAKGALVGNMLFESNPGDAGMIRIGFAGSSNLSGSGPVAHLNFKAVGKPGDTSPLTLKVTTISSASEAKPAIQVINGSIEIVEKHKPWTEEPTSQHAMDALKMSVKLIPEQMAADVDSDGKVTSTDARLILKAVVGK